MYSTGNIRTKISLLLVLFFLGALAKATEINPTGIVKIYLGTHNPDDEQEFIALSQASGFFISADGIVATAFHSVMNLTGSVRNIVFVDPKTQKPYYFTEIIALDPKADIALLKVEEYKPETFYPPNNLSQKEYISKNIIMAGFPKQKFQMFVGEVMDVSNVGAFFVKANIQNKEQAILQGASGGPVFFENGELAGINSTNEDIYVNISIAQNLQNLLNDNLSCVSDKCITKAIEQLVSEGKRGEVSAQYALGNINYSMGNTVSAFNWYRLAGEQGLAIAQHNVGVLYQFEKELNYDYKSAVKWYEMAGEQNFIPALHNLAMIYYHGNGGSLQNYQKSAELYQKAALLGDYSSQNRLSEMYMEGKGVDQSFQKALYWKKKAKEQNEQPITFLEISKIWLNSLF